MTISIWPINWIISCKNDISAAFERFCSNLASYIWQGTIDKALKQHTFEFMLTNDQKTQKIAEIFNQCGFHGSWFSESKRKMIEGKVQEKIALIRPLLLDDEEPLAASLDSFTIQEEHLTDERAVKGMILGTLGEIFAAEQNQDIVMGVLIANTLIPQNIRSFDAKLSQVQHPGYQYPTIVKTDFSIHLTEDKTTSLPKSGLEHLAGTVASNNLNIEINASKVISGSVDHITKTIYFTPGHINGKVQTTGLLGRVAGLFGSAARIEERTLLSIQYSHPSQIIVKLAEKNNLSKIIEQFWSKDEFEGTFEDLTWPSAERTEEQKEAIRETASELSVEIQSE